jgi:hypothetical protein
MGVMALSDIVSKIPTTSGAPALIICGETKLAITLVWCKVRWT